MITAQLEELVASDRDSVPRRRHCTRPAAARRWALAAFISSVGMAASPATWEERAPLPEPNGGLVSASIGGEIVVIGGTNWTGGTKRWLDRIRLYDPGRNRWRDGGRLDAPLAYAASGGDGRTLWVAGGTSGELTHRSLWQVEPGGSPRLVARLNDDFVYAGGGLIGSTLYVLGGSDDEARLDTLTPRFLAIDVESGAITRLANYPEPGFFVGATAACGSRFFAFGGARWDKAARTVVNLSAANVYSLATGRWTPLPPLPFAVRGITAVVLDDGHLYLAGGYKDGNGGFTDQAWVFEIRSGTYVAAPPLPYPAMVGLVKTGDWLYCLGGEDRMRHRTDAVFRIRWQELLPSAR